MRRCHTASGKASTEQYYGHTQLMWIISLSCWCTVLTTFQHTCSSQRAQLSISNGKKEIGLCWKLSLCGVVNEIQCAMRTSVPCIWWYISRRMACVITSLCHHKPDFTIDATYEFFAKSHRNLPVMELAVQSNTRYFVPVWRELLIIKSYIPCS